MMTKTRLNLIADLSKKIKDVDKMIEILKFELEENIFENTDKTFVNFTIVKKEIEEVPNITKNNITKGLLESISKGTAIIEVSTNTAEYSESCLIPNDLAIKIQVMVLNHYKNYRKNLIKQLKEI